MTSHIASHWYTVGGESAYGATLREARKLGLLPSITTICKEKAEPGLEEYKQIQCVLSAMKTLPLNGEGQADYIKRIITSSHADGTTAAEFGNTIHGMIENYLRGDMVKENKFWPSIKKWLDENIAEAIEIEKILVSTKNRYGGKIDCLAVLTSGKTALIDWKTQSIKSEKKVSKYDKWLYQLAASKKVVNETYPFIDNIICLNVVISSVEPDRIEVIEWSEDDIERGGVIFDSLTKIFYLSRKL